MRLILRPLTKMKPLKQMYPAIRFFKAEKPSKENPFIDPKKEVEKKYKEKMLKKLIETESEK